MTPEQLQDILDKSATVHSTKQDYDAAVSANNTAITNANAARAAWLASVNAGDNSTTRTNMLNQYVTAAVAKIASDAALTAAQQPYGAAQDAMNIAVDAVIAESTP